MATRAASTIGASTSFSATCGGGKGGRGGGRVLTSRPRLTGRPETKTRRKRRSGAMGVRALRTTMSGDEDESQSPSSVAWMSKYGNRRLNYSEAGLGGTRTRSLSGASAADRGDPAGVVDVGKQAADEDYNVGVLLLNLGGPETLDDVQPFLYNLFADPDIIRLPPVVQFLQGFLANVLSTSRAPKSREAYESIGGGSPLRRITDEQAKALQMSLESRGLEVKTYVGMRYWKPFTEDALEAIKRDAVNRLVVLPLYPQFSISTSGSSLRLLEQYFAEDQDLANVRHTVIPSWYQRPGYIKAMAQMITQTLKKDFEDDKEPIIFFSAHGVPVSYVEDAGDPYKVEMEECVKLIVEELKSMGVTNEHILAYQSRVGPVEWLKPYTDDTIRELGKAGTKALCAVPISFVSEHIETLEEIDMEYRELAEECGIEKWGRVPALDTDPLFIDDLADAVIEALPYTTRMNKRDSSDGLSSVTDLLASYDFEKLAIPMPDSSWNKSTAKKTDQFSGSSSDLVNVSIVTLVIFVFLQYQAGANGLFGSFGVFRNW